VVFNTYLVFSINTMSISGSCESCASSHCLRTVHTCGTRRRRVVRAYSSFVALVLSRVRFARVVTRCLRVSRVPLTQVARLTAHRSHVSRVSVARVARRLLVIINCYRLRTLTLIMLICRVIYSRYLT
jgi:hypothetical protein